MQKVAGGLERTLKEFCVIWVVLLFVIILLHEFGHCFAARHEGGDASEILMWPLGGLASCDIPHSPRAHFVTSAGGPLVNMAICIASALALFPYEFLPPLNPLNVSQIYKPQLYNWSDGRYLLQNDYPVYVKEQGAREVLEDRNIDSVFVHDGKLFAKMEGSKEAFPVEIDRSVKHYNAFVLWTARIFWMSWVLFLFNLLPAFPLDGGRLLQTLIWGRTGDYRRGTMVAIYTGFAFAFAFMFISFWTSQPMLLGMAVFIWIFCRQQYIALEMSETESVFGYDFSQGYTSLEKDDRPCQSRKSKVPSSVGCKKLAAARREARILEAEQQAADELRMDGLLDKIHRNGKESLSDEERRFMDRVSALAIALDGATGRS